MPKHIYVDAISKEITEIEITGEELVAYKKMVEETEQLAIKEKEIDNKRAALLEKLGITEEEAKLLLG